MQTALRCGNTEGAKYAKAGLEGEKVMEANATVSRTDASFSLCFQIDVIQKQRRSEHAKIRRIQSAVPYF